MKDICIQVSISVQLPNEVLQQFRFGVHLNRLLSYHFDYTGAQGDQSFSLFGNHECSQAPRALPFCGRENGLQGRSRQMSRIGSMNQHHSHPKRGRKETCRGKNNALTFVRHVLIVFIIRYLDKNQTRILTFTDPDAVVEELPDMIWSMHAFKFVLQAYEYMHELLSSSVNMHIPCYGLLGNAFSWHFASPQSAFLAFIKR